MGTRKIPVRAFAYRWLWLVLGWSMVATVVYLSLMPSPPQLPAHFGDKAAHVSAYCSLMLWFSSLYTGPTRGGFGFGFVLMGLLLEILQDLGGYRLADPADMTANVAGVACGWILAVTPAGGLLTRLDGWLIRQRARVSRSRDDGPSA